MQAGRAIAAFLVVWLHLGGTFAYEKYFNTAAFETPFDIGLIGVIYFFILSGFLITHIHGKDADRPGRFLSYATKRMIRIYPVYWVVFGLAFVGLKLTADNPDLIPTGSTLLASLALFPMDESLVGGTGAPVILVAWTLQFEMYFYLLFGIAILSRKLAMGFVAAIVVCFFTRQLVEVPFLVRFLSSAFVAAFALGVLTSQAFRRFEIPKLLSYAIVVIALPIFVYAGHYEATKILGRDLQLLSMAVPAALILFSLLQLERAGHSLSGGKLVQFFGDASYSIYLIHLPLISLMCKLSVKAGLAGHGPVVDSLNFAFQFLVCIAAGSFLHLTFEKPVIGFLRSRLLKRPQMHVVNSGHSPA